MYHHSGRLLSNGVPKATEGENSECVCMVLAETNSMFTNLTVYKLKLVYFCMHAHAWLVLKVIEFFAKLYSPPGMKLQPSYNSQEVDSICSFSQYKVTLWKLVAFVCPLMTVLSVQRISRPMINLLVARFSATKCLAAEVSGSQVV